MPDGPAPTTATTRGGGSSVAARVWEVGPAPGSGTDPNLAGRSFVPVGLAGGGRFFGGRAVGWHLGLAFGRIRSPLGSRRGWAGHRAPVPAGVAAAATTVPASATTATVAATAVVA